MITHELLKLMANDDYDFWERMLKGKDIPYELLTYLAENVTKSHVIKNVRLGLQNGIRTEWIKLYAKDCYAAAQMEKIREGLEYYKDCDEKVELIKLYCNQKLNEWHMNTVLKAIQSNFSELQIEQLASSEIDWRTAYEKYEKFLNENRVKQLSELISEYNEEKY